MARRDVSRIFLWVAALAVVLFTGMSAIADNPQVSKERGRGRGVGEKRGEGHAWAKAPASERQTLFDRWRASRDKKNAAQKSGDSLRKAIPIASGALGRASVVINDSNAILFTKVFPGGPACDPDLNGNPPQFGPTDFVGCLPMQLVHRSAAGAETVLATEGQTIGAGPLRLAGWKEFYDMNNSGVAAFGAAVAGQALLGEAFGPDETTSHAFIAGPSTPLTRVGGTGDVVGGRTLCGLGPMVEINDAGQVIFEGLFLTGANQCSENNKGIVRFTPPATLEHLFGIGTNVGGAVTVTQWGDFNDGDFFSGINSLGHTAVSVTLSDGDQAVYLLAGPGTFTEVARSGNAGPGGIFDRNGAQVYINNSDQVLYKAAIGGDGNPSTALDGVDNLLLFTPGTGNQKIVAVTDPVPGGGTYQGFGAFAHLNNSGNVVFRAGLVGAAAGVEDLEQAGIFHWTRATNTFNQVIRVGPGTFGLFNDVIGINDADAVFFGVHNGSRPAGFDDDEEQEGSIRRWTLAGGVQTVVALGQPLDGPAITAIFAQHIPFRRQFNATCSFATFATTNNNLPDEVQENLKQGRLFAVFNTTCGVVGPTATPTPTGTLLATSTPTTTPITGQVPVVPTLSMPMLILLGLALAGVAFFVLRKV